jgi:hypothetical protein
MNRLPSVLRSLSKVVPRRSLRFYAVEPINQRVGVPVSESKEDPVQQQATESTNVNEPTKESVGVPEPEKPTVEPIVNAVPQQLPKSEPTPDKLQDEIPRVDVSQKAEEKVNEEKATEEKQETESTYAKPTNTTWRGFFMALLGGALLVGSGYYTLHWHIIDTNADLIREANKLREIKTKEQIELEAVRAQEQEEEDLLRRRQIARDLKRQEQEKQFLNRTKQDIVRNWNNVWSSLGFALENTTEDIKRKEQEKIRNRIFDEVEVSQFCNAELILNRQHMGSLVIMCQLKISKLLRLTNKMCQVLIYNVGPNQSNQGKSNSKSQSHHEKTLVQHISCCYHWSSLLSVQQTH